jgi:hypothetical protein
LKKEKKEESMKREKIILFLFFIFFFFFHACAYYGVEKGGKVIGFPAPLFGPIINGTFQNSLPYPVRISLEGKTILNLKPGQPGFQQFILRNYEKDKLIFTATVLKGGKVIGTERYWYRVDQREVEQDFIWDIRRFHRLDPSYSY